MYCSKCGNEIIDEEETKCPKCGNTLRLIIEEKLTEELTEEEKKEIIKLEKTLKIINCTLFPILMYATFKIIFEFIFVLFFLVLAPYVFGPIVEDFSVITYINVILISGIVIKISNYSIKQKLEKYKTRYGNFGKHQVSKNTYIATTKLFGAVGGQYFLTHENKKGTLILLSLICSILAILILWTINGQLFLYILRAAYIMAGFVQGLSKSCSTMAESKIADENGKIRIN